MLSKYYMPYMCQYARSEWEDMSMGRSYSFKGLTNNFFTLSVTHTGFQRIFIQSFLSASSDINSPLGSQCGRNWEAAYIIYSICPQSPSKHTGHSFQAQEPHNEAPLIASTPIPLPHSDFCLPLILPLDSFIYFTSIPYLRSGFQNQSPIGSQDQGSEWASDQS